MFTITANNTIPYPDEINDNFYHVAQGSILPKSGNYLNLTSNVCNIGASSTVWKTFYGNSIYNNTIISKSCTMWHMVAEQIFTASTARVEFSGLNGDAEQYQIFIFGNYPSATTFYMYLNGNSSYSCGYEEIYAATTSISNLRASATTIVVGQTSNTLQSCFTQIELFAKTSENKKLKIHRADYAHSTGCYNMYLSYYLGQRYISTSLATSTLTSLVFTATNNFSNLSYISIWKRQI